MGGIVRSDEKNSHISNLMNRFDQEAFINFLSNFFTPLFDSTFLLSIADTNINVSSNLKGKKVKKLIEMIQNLTLFIHTI